MHPEDHFLDRELHIILNFQCPQEKVVSVICQIIGSTADLLVQINDTVGNITDVNRLPGHAVKVIALEIHGPAFVRKYVVDNIISENMAILICHGFTEILRIDTIYKGTDIVNRARFFLQGLLHDKQQDRKIHIQLFCKFVKSILFPDGFLAAACEEKSVQTDILHPLRKSFQEVILHD